MNAPSLDAVLAEVNRIRVAGGVDGLSALPKGRRDEANRCPLAVAFRPLGIVEIRAGHATAVRASDDFYLSDTLCTFVSLFDDGVYPELVA